MAKFTKIPADTFKQLQINAGVVLSEFTPATGTFEPENQIGATTGGVTFSATPTYSDYGSDVDNCPKNTMEMKRLDDVEVKLSGTFVTATTASAKSLMAAADIVLCRSGASTLAELTAIGKPAVLVPSPNVVNNHQEKNARVLEHGGGAVVLLESDAGADVMLSTINGLLSDKEKLTEMEEHMRDLAVENATDEITSIVLSLAAGE